MQDGGGAIKGLIEEYLVAAGDNVSTGSFVTFVSNYNSSSRVTPKEIGENTFESPFKAATLLNENKVFLVYSLAASNNYVERNILCNMYH